MPDQVLILADQQDVHARVVAERLRQNYRIESTVWSFGEFPCEQTLSFDLETQNDFKPLGRTEELLPSNLRSVWWRRPNEPRISKRIEDDRSSAYAKAEARHFLHGIIEALKVPVINHPRYQRSASLKPYQLHVAKRAGLTCPRTLLSNDPEAIFEFWVRHQPNCIYKTFASPPWTAVETRRMTAEDAANLESAALCPMIVQEEVERGFDIRVNIFGREVYASSIVTTHPETAVDSRFDLTAVWRSIELPNGIVTALLDLMSMLNLEYGCIDMRQRPNGEIVFLEINPAGQFLFIEVDTGQPLSASMATLLARIGEQGPSSAKKRKPV